MSTIIQIPMNDETRISLEDCFIDSSSMDARKFIFDKLKIACQDAKKSVRNNVTPINKRGKNGQVQPSEYNINDVNLSDYKLESKSDWLPKNLNAVDNKPIELKVGDNTIKYLQIYSQLIGIRHEQYNLAEDEYIESTIKEMKENGSNQQIIDNFLKSQEPLKKERLSQIPKTFEEAIYTSLWPLIQQKINESDGQMFDREYNEIYKKVAEKKPVPKNL